ncbi:MAG: type II toxin-antitoxin system VapC family toxin [Gemmatimonadaceae bacterium]
MTPVADVASRSPRRVRERPVAPIATLFDANVVFDLVLWREPWCRDVVALFEAATAGRLRPYIAVHTVTTLWYVLSRELGGERARAALRRILASITVVPLDGDDLLRALTLPTTDFEDACQMVAAERAGASVIVTRDRRHYRDSAIAVLSPAHLVARLGGF